MIIRKYRSLVHVLMHSQYSIMSYQKCYLKYGNYLWPFSEILEYALYAYSWKTCLDIFLKWEHSLCVLLTWYLFKISSFPWWYLCHCVCLLLHSTFFKCPKIWDKKQSLVNSYCLFLQFYLIIIYAVWKKFFLLISMYHQVVNGLLQREDWDSAIQVPLGIIPAGYSSRYASAKYLLHSFPFFFNYGNQAHNWLNSMFTQLYQRDSS